MLAHHGGQDLARQRQVVGGEPAEDRGRLLDQVDDLVDECGLALDVDRAADARRQLLRP